MSGKNCRFRNEFSLMYRGCDIGVYHLVLKWTVLDCNTWFWVKVPPIESTVVAGRIVQVSLYRMK